MERVNDTHRGRRLLQDLIEGWHDYQYCWHRLDQLNQPWLAKAPLRWKYTRRKGWWLVGSVLPPPPKSEDR